MHITIDKMETLRYLGYKGGGIPDDIGRMIDGCIRTIEETVVPRTVFRIFEANEIKLQGKDIKDHLKGCEKYVLMAATLGVEMDTLIRRAQVSDMAKAVILDACGSSGIENACDRLTGAIRKEQSKKQRQVTGRFSPGYGDLPISQQKELCRMLDAERKIGLYVSESGTMIPGKSVMAIMGISENRLTLPQSGCKICNMYETCEFRKGGKNCGNCGN